MEIHRRHSIPWSVLASAAPSISYASRLNSGASIPPSHVHDSGDKARTFKSFAEVVQDRQDSAIINHVSLPKPCIRGNRLCVKILQEDYVQGLANCKNRLHGRVMFPKGTATVKLGELKTKSKIYRSFNPIGVLSPLEEGSLNFLFNLEVICNLFVLHVSGICTLDPFDYFPGPMNSVHIRLDSQKRRFGFVYTICHKNTGFLMS